MTTKKSTIATMKEANKLLNQLHNENEDLRTLAYEKEEMYKTLKKDCHEQLKHCNDELRRCKVNIIN